MLLCLVVWITELYLLKLFSIKYARTAKNINLFIFVSFIHYTIKFKFFFMPLYFFTTNGGKWCVKYRVEEDYIIF